MADIVNLGDRAQREADVRYAARMDLTAKMIPVMIQTMDKFYAMGRQPGAHCSICKPPSTRSTAASVNFVAVGISGNDHCTLSESVDCSSSRINLRRQYQA